MTEWISLSWQDSEVLRVESRPSKAGLATLRLVLSAACVTAFTNGRRVQGFVSPLEVNFTDAHVEGELGDCIGSIREGHVAVGQTRSGEVALPWLANSPIELALHFRLGGVLSIHATSGRCEVPPDARFFESHAC